MDSEILCSFKVCKSRCPSREKTDIGAFFEGRLVVNLSSYTSWDCIHPSFLHANPKKNRCSTWNICSCIHCVHALIWAHTLQLFLLCKIKCYLPLSYVSYVIRFYVCINPSELPMPERKGTCYRLQYICPSHVKEFTVFQFPENIIITHSWPQSISAQVKSLEKRPATLWGQNALQEGSKRVWEQSMHIAIFTQNAPQGFCDLQVRNLLSQRYHCWSLYLRENAKPVSQTHEKLGRRISQPGENILSPLRGGGSVNLGGPCSEVAQTRLDKRIFLIIPQIVWIAMCHTWKFLCAENSAGTELPEHFIHQNL